MLPGRRVLEKARKVLPHAVVLRVVVGAVGLHFYRRQFKRVGRRSIGWWGERQLVVVMVGVVVVVQAGLHVPRELHLGHGEGHLVRAESRAGCHVIAPELKHP